MKFFEKCTKTTVFSGEVPTLASSCVFVFGLFLKRSIVFLKGNAPKASPGKPVQAWGTHSVLIITSEAQKGGFSELAGRPSSSFLTGAKPLPGDSLGTHYYVNLIGYPIDISEENWGG